MHGACHIAQYPTQPCNFAVRDAPRLSARRPRIAEQSVAARIPGPEFSTLSTISGSFNTPVWTMRFAQQQRVERGFLTHKFSCLCRSKANGPSLLLTKIGDGAVQRASGGRLRIIAFIEEANTCLSVSS